MYKIDMSAKLTMHITSSACQKQTYISFLADKSFKFYKSVVRLFLLSLRLLKKSQKIKPLIKYIAYHLPIHFAKKTATIVRLSTLVPIPGVQRGKFYNIVSSKLLYYQCFLNRPNFQSSL